MTGVLVAGGQMHTYITRHGLGSGPNLSCTALYLTLLALVKAERTIGACVAAPSPSPAALAATLTRLAPPQSSRCTRQRAFGQHLWRQQKQRDDLLPCMAGLDRRV